jgi:hypothetical protein
MVEYAHGCAMLCCERQRCWKKHVECLHELRLLSQHIHFTDQCMLLLLRGVVRPGKQCMPMQQVTLRLPPTM